MNIIEALKYGKNLRRENGTVLIGWQLQKEPLKLALEDILAEDWEFDGQKIEVTKAQLEEAFYKHDYMIGRTYNLRPFLKELGFKE